MRGLTPILVVISLGVIPADAQTSSGAGSGWRAPRTPDGRPDLQGLWTNTTVTPLERPGNLAGKEFFTPEEAAAYEQGIVQKREQDPNDGQGDVADPKVWWERGTRVVRWPDSAADDGGAEKNDGRGRCLQATFRRWPRGPVSARALFVIADVWPAHASGPLQQ
jgi:hypothetical protein